MKPRILLMGAGGHARACVEVVESHGGFDIGGLLGLATEVGSRSLAYPILGTEDDLRRLVSDNPNALVSVGQIKTAAPRVRLFEALRSAGYALPVIVSPFARVSRHATLGEGTIVMHGAVVNAAAVVGRNCIVNSQSLIEHDAIVGDHCHVATGALVNGGARIGDESFIGSGATVMQGIHIGARCVIGMGERVRANCVDGSLVATRAKRS